MSGLIPTISSITNPWIDPQSSSAIWSGEPSRIPASVQRATLRDESVERSVRELVARVRRLEPGNRAAEHHHVVRGVGEGGVAVAAGAAAEVGERIVGGRVGLHGVDQALEALGVELVDHAVLAAEAAVEAHGRAAGGGGDAPDAERARALLREQLAGGLEDPLPLFVTGSCHQLPSFFHRRRWDRPRLDTCNNDVIA